MPPTCSARLVCRVLVFSSSEASSRGTKSSQETFPPSPSHSDRGGKWLSSPPSPAQFPRGHGSTVGGRGPKTPILGPQRSRDAPQLGDASSKWSQLGNGQEYLGATLGLGFWQLLGQGGVPRASSAPEHPTHTDTHPAAHQEGQREASWSSPWAPSLPQSHHQTHFTETASILPKVTQQRRCRRGVSLTP